MNDYTPKFSDEGELQLWLKNQFENAGWSADREVSPFGSNDRADLIVQSDKYPPIGIETKHMNTAGSGGVFGRAFEQITKQYRGKEYPQGVVDLWAVAPYRKDPEEKSPQVNKFIREFFNYYGIGYISLNTWKLVIDFNYNKTETKIFINDISPYDHSNIDKSKYGDRVEIAKTVGGKLERV